MKDTKIEWADHSWSPWRGCTKVSPGCANCYAEALSKRNPAVLGEWGRGRPRVLAKNWRDPVRWDRLQADRSCGRCDFDEAEGYLVSQCDRCAVRPRVFPSLCDWLDEEVSPNWLADFLALIHATPNLDWLLLTKRPDHWRTRLAEVLAEKLNGPRWPAWDFVDEWLNGTPPSNVWVGTSVEDQERADERIPELLQIPATVRWLSLEPLLGMVDLTGFLWGKSPRCQDCPGDADCEHGMYSRKTNGRPSLDWIVVGGESGPRARPCNIERIRSLVTQGRDAGVPVFVKQIGRRPIAKESDLWRSHGEPDDWKPRSGFVPMKIQDLKGGNPSEWPEDLRVREFLKGAEF